MGKRVCVIGAGASGLAAAKEAMAEGHAVAVLEAGGAVGGAFAARGTAGSRAYRSLHLTISNYYMAFSDRPPPDAMGAGCFAAPDAG